MGQIGVKQYGIHTTLTACAQHLMDIPERSDGRVSLILFIFFTVRTGNRASEQVRGPVDQWLRY